MGRKHSGKKEGENAGFRAFSPFPAMFLKGFLLRVVKSHDCVAKSKMNQALQKWRSMHHQRIAIGPYKFTEHSLSFSSRLRKFVNNKISDRPNGMV